MCHVWHYTYMYVHKNLNAADVQLAQFREEVVCRWCLVCRESLSASALPLPTSATWTARLMLNHCDVSTELFQREILCP